MRKGTVKWFSDKKGFGFVIDSESGTDVFVHFSAIVGEGHRTLLDGEEVEFELDPEQKGSRAKTVMR